LRQPQSNVNLARMILGRREERLLTAISNRETIISEP
jgi:hypothetical protein